jgi:hypothetical protein
MQAGCHKFAEIETCRKSRGPEWHLGPADHSKLSLLVTDWHKDEISVNLSLPVGYQHGVYALQRGVDLNVLKISTVDRAQAGDPFVAAGLHQTLEPKSS